MAVKEINKIIVSGLVYSGSGAVVDFLKDTGRCIQYPDEFNLWRVYVLSRLHVLKSSKEESLALAVREKIVRVLFPQRKFPGGIRDAVVIGSLLTFLLRKLKRQSRMKRMRMDRVIMSKNMLHRAIRNKTRETAEKPNEVITEEMKKLVHHLAADTVGEKDLSVIFDQAISLLYSDGINEIRDSLNVFSPCKVVIVYRNPADQFSDILFQGDGARREKALYKRFLYLYDGSYCERFCKWQLDMLDSLVRIREAHSASVMAVKFEDFINDSSNTISLLKEFLDFPDVAIAHNSFKPEVSARNIGLPSDKLEQSDTDCINRYIDSFSEKWGKLSG